MSLLSKFFFFDKEKVFLVESSNNLSEIFFLTFWFRGRIDFDVGVTN